MGLALATAGYDVWLGNARGNKYSSRHLYVNDSTREFWNFSLDELGRYDIPANLEFITKTTGVEKVTFIGHSAGSASFFASISDLETTQRVQKMVSKFIVLSPILF
jgi:pimeloyl-ACP methyl ester carboxylesterase